MASTYTSQGVPIIQCGTINTNSSGQFTINFNPTFPTGSNIVMTGNARLNNNTDTIMVTIAFTSPTTSSVTGIATGKDGRGGQSGGGPFVGTIFWVAIQQ